MKKVFSIFIALIITLAAVNVTAASVDTMKTTTAWYIHNSITDPQVGSVGGEWAVIGLKKSGIDVPQEYYDRYYSNLVRYLTERNGVLHERKYTEYSRVVIALNAIGKNPADVSGYNLISPLCDYLNTIKQGLNGAVWALIALDSGNYDMVVNENAEIQATREKYVDFILTRQLSDGGWAMASDGECGDVDVTAMAIKALSVYIDDIKVNNAIEKGLEFLSENQSENGGFSSYGIENSDSGAQVLMAMTSVGVSVNDSRFIKNGNTVIDFITQFYIDSGGFKHTLDDSLNLMATEQCLYALSEFCMDEEKVVNKKSDDDRLKAFLKYVTDTKEMIK